MKDLPLAAMAAIAIGVGLIAGTALDPMPPRTITTRGGYRVLEADFHAHTRFSDGFLSPFDLVVHARRQGLHAIAVTEHNLVFPALLARWFSRATGGPSDGGARVARAAGASRPTRSRRRRSST